MLITFLEKMCPLVAYFIIIKERRKRLEKRVVVFLRNDVLWAFVCFYNNKIQSVTFV